jgi:hypothetical protein
MRYTFNNHPIDDSVKEQIRVNYEAAEPGFAVEGLLRHDISGQEAERTSQVPREESDESFDIFFQRVSKPPDGGYRRRRSRRSKRSRRPRKSRKSKRSRRSRRSRRRH